MGAGHSHPAHPNHRLRRAKCSIRGKKCGLCHGHITPGEMAYRCTAAECSSFYIHDACFQRYPDKLKHFSGHRLALTDVVAGGGSCDVCAMRFDCSCCVYSCRQNKHRGCTAEGFRAHLHCARLPQHIGEPKKHTHKPLVLGAPPAGGRARKCLNCNRCGGERAWSYRCSACPDVELCLPCVMGRDDDTTCCSCNPCLCGGAGAGEALTCAGFAVGKFLEGLVWGCTGIKPSSVVQANGTSV